MLKQIFKFGLGSVRCLYCLCLYLFSGEHRWRACWKFNHLLVRLPEQTGAAANLLNSWKHDLAILRFSELSLWFSSSIRHSIHDFKRSEDKVKNEETHGHCGCRNRSSCCLRDLQFRDYTTYKRCSWNIIFFLLKNTF